MTLINLRLSQIEPSTDSEIALRSQIDDVSSNVGSFETYANSTFSTGAGFANSVVVSDGLTYLTSSNANSAHADSNVIVLSKSISSKHNLLVDLDGVIQHVDAYELDGVLLTLSNSDPIPKDISVSVRHLQSDAVAVSNTQGAQSVVGANGALGWDYESKRLYVYNGIDIGGYISGSALQAIKPFQGSNFGYSSGGSPEPVAGLTIDKFPFSTDSNASDVGDLTAGGYGGAGASSEIAGYTAGRGFPSINIIDKFPFTSDSNATDVGDLTGTRNSIAGQSSKSYGYASGGGTPSPSASLDTIDKFPFASDSNAVDIANLTVGRERAAGQTSSVSGYTSGGNPSPTNGTIIDKFPFSSDSNATDVGDLTQGRYRVAGQSSSTHGYTTGGSVPGLDTIDKFPFASDTNASDVGNLSQVRGTAAGQSSTSSGYTSGGFPTLDTIDKFPFSSDSDATDVGNLTQGRREAAGQQY